MTFGCFSRSRRTMASAEAGEWWQTGKISSSSRSARSTSSTMPEQDAGQRARAAGERLGGGEQLLAQRVKVLLDGGRS